ncbi:nucleotidyltransferase domain-containing protein [Candidatus Woesearchaeota archaeon]|nr:nucleotidyltransferase domain-containing protein [Candidatus Woesearchaeota archaeon]
MIQKCNILGVAKVFFDEPTRQHYLIEVSKKANLAHTSTKSHIITLKKNGLITETTERKGKRNFPIYQANLNSKKYRDIKKIYNQLAIQQSGIIDHLKEKTAPRTIILFGSYRKGEDTEESDIDLFIEAKKESINLTKYEKTLGKKIQLHFSEDFKRCPKELKNNIANGIVLQGYLEAF